MFVAGYMLFAFEAFDAIVLAVLYSSPVHGLISRGRFDPSVLILLTKVKC